MFLAPSRILRPRPPLAATALLAGTALLALAACGRQVEAPAAASQATSVPLSDARLAAVYERACMSCHEAAGSGAPLRGDRAAWAPREATGLGALVSSVRQGKGTMPPMGWCPECSDEDFAVLISHLTTRASP